MSEIAKAGKSSRYVDHEIELALRHVAINNGNTRRASRELAASGIKVPHQTLYSWYTRHHAERYAEIRKEVMPSVKAWAETKHMDVMSNALDAVNEYVDRARNDLKELPARDVPGGARNLATVAGISGEQASKLRGEATSIIEHRTTPDELMRKMERTGITFVEAEEVEATPSDEAKAVPTSLPAVPRTGQTQAQ